MAAYGGLQPGSRVTDATVAVAGRVVSKRTAGKLVFYDIEGDAGVRVQVMATMARLVPLPGEAEGALKARFAAMNDGVRLGDIIGKSLWEDPAWARRRPSPPVGMSRVCVGRFAIPCDRGLV